MKIEYKETSTDFPNFKKGDYVTDKREGAQWYEGIGLCLGFSYNSMEKYSIMHVQFIKNMPVSCSSKMVIRDKTKVVPEEEVALMKLKR